MSGLPEIRLGATTCAYKQTVDYSYPMAQCLLIRSKTSAVGLKGVLSLISVDYRQKSLLPDGYYQERSATGVIALQIVGSHQEQSRQDRNCEEE